MNRDNLLRPLAPGKLPAWLLKKALPIPSDPRVLVGPGVGRDAAAIAVGDRVLVAKNDPITFADDGAAFHLVEVNANDIACMGATPRWLLVTGLLPQGVTPADVLHDFADLKAACTHRSVELVGGHTEIVAGLTRPILVGLMLGEAEPAELIRPGRAGAGDALILTKALAIEGTALLARDYGQSLEPLLGQDLVRAAADLLINPGISIVADAELARSAGGITALHDPTEGGLATAVRELASASDVGVELDLDRLDILPETLAIADALGLDPLGMLASGSLLIATRPEAAEDVVANLRRHDIPAAVVGHLTDEAGEFATVRDGQRGPLPEFAQDEVVRAIGALEGKSGLETRS
jgi:hydrogenase maturation factor